MIYNSTIREAASIETGDGGKATDTSRVFSFLLKLARGEEIPAAYTIPVEDVIRIAAQHRVRPLLARWGRDDSSVKDVLYRWSVLNARQHALLRRVVTVLSGAGVGYVLIKGASLCGLWGEEDRRDYDDIDILIRPESFGRAAELFDGIGMYAAYTLSPSVIRNLARVGRHMGFDGDAGESVEVSSRGLVPYFANIPLDSLFSGSVDVDIDGVKMRCIGPVEGMIYVSVHGCSHHWTRLSWVLDSMSMLEHLTIEECRCCAVYAKRWGVLRCLRIGVYMVKELGLPLDKEKEHAICGDQCDTGYAVRLAHEAAENLRRNPMHFSVSTRRMLRYQFLCRERCRDRWMMFARLLWLPSLNDIIYTGKHRWISRHLCMVRLFGVIGRRLLFPRGRNGFF